MVGALLITPIILVWASRPRAHFRVFRAELGVLAVSVMLRHVWPADRKIPSTVGVVVRAGWLTIAAAGVAALVTDVIAVT